MFSHRINRETELRLILHPHASELFDLLDLNREHLRPWHPWVDGIGSVIETERLILKWLQQFATNRGFHAGIFYRERLCGVINHLNIDWNNRSTVLSYWLDAAHQGRGLMTAACRGMISHAFETLDLHRVTIECASRNARSRRIPERLGFTFEGIVRGAEWLHDHFADHAIYGLLKEDKIPPSRPAFPKLHVTRAAQN